MTFGNEYDSQKKVFKEIIQEERTKNIDDKLSNLSIQKKKRIES